MESTLEFKNSIVKNFESFEDSLNGERNSDIHKRRKEAINLFNKLPFPTLKNEEWRYTNISPLLKYNFELPGIDSKVSEAFINKCRFNGSAFNVTVFINGQYAQTNSRLLDLPEGVIIGSIADEIKKDSEIVRKHFGSYAKYEKQIFTALSTAFAKDGAFIYVPDGKIIEKPVHLLFITTNSANKIITQPRSLFVVGKNSQIKIVEHYVSESENVHFTNSVTEVVAEEGSVIDHIRINEENKKSFQVARMEVDQEDNSNFTTHLFSTGSLISRNDFNSRFNDEGGECTLNGLYLLEDNQLFDTHTVIDHAKPNCNSHEHYKGILEDNSKGVFNGKVVVRQDAQKTNAFQQNNNILLSENANVNTKPQLEIFADDVKCSHGATIGQLDEEAKFYLKTRGIGEDAAMSILIHAFASDVLKSIKIDSIRNYLEKILTERFNQ